MLSYVTMLIVHKAHTGTSGKSVSYEHYYFRSLTYSPLGVKSVGATQKHGKRVAFL
jgi:hypothetical protein